MNRRLTLVVAACLSITLISCTEQSTEPDPDSSGKLRTAVGQRQVPGQYIVVLEEDARPHPAADELAARHSGRVMHVYRRALNGFSVWLSARDAEALARDPRVAFVEPDLEVHAVQQTLPEGIDRAEADQNPTADIDGQDERVGVDIAILDTGVDLDHPDLNAREGTNCITPGASADDNNGHGTHVAGTAAALDNDSHVVGMAPGALIWAVKVLDADGGGTVSSVVCGIDYVTANAGEIAVANMSLSGQGLSDATRTAIQNSVAAGVFYAVAAGNSAIDVYGQDGTFGTDDDIFPASYPEVAAISAMTELDGSAGGNGGRLFLFGCGVAVDDTFARCFSNYSASVVAGNPVNSPGAAIDLAAPGVDVLSTWNDGGTASITGTSMASPHVAGAAALYIAANGRANDAAGVHAIRQALIDAGQAQSDWNSRGARDVDANPEPLVQVGDLAPPAPVTDIAVTDVSAPASATPGDVVSVDVTVQNVGNQDVGADIAVALDDDTDGVMIGSQVIAGGLAAGASTTLTYSWDTDGASLGSHTLTASHDFADDEPGNDAASTTVEIAEDGGGGGGGTVAHVGDLDGSATSQGLRWTAIATVTVHDEDHNPVADATVSGAWTRGSGECTTDASGQCQLTRSEIPNYIGSITLTITGVTHATLSYDAAANHDPDGDSDGTSLSVSAP